VHSGRGAETAGVENAGVDRRGGNTGVEKARVIKYRKRSKQKTTILGFRDGEPVLELVEPLG